METQQPKWNPWPVSIIAFFCLAIAGAVGFVIFCQMHPTDLVTRDYYEQEIRHQAQMERVRRTLELPTEPTIAYHTAAREIRIVLPPEHASAETSGSIHLYRPSAAGLDQRLALSLKPDGSQTIDARALRPGLWSVKVSWSHAGKEYFLDRKLEISS